jgi:trigger factor
LGHDKKNLDIKEKMAVSDKPAVTIEEISPVKRKISVAVPWTKVVDELNKVYRDAAKTAKIKGFRPGKIPRKILEMHYREQVEEEAVSNLVNQYYWDTLQENRIQAVSKPQIDQKGIEAETDFSFSATVEVEPFIEPKDYIGLELEKEELIVTDEDLQKKFDEIRQMFATMEELQEDRGLLLGDFVTIDFEGYLDGKTRNELKAENYFLEIGSGTLVPGFEDQLLGLKNGETKTITVTFPEAYHAKDLATKDVEFTVKVKAIRIKKLPEIDEDFIKNFERYESLEALRADVRKTLEEEKNRGIEDSLQKKIADRLLEGNEFEVPPSYVERQIFYMMSETQRRMIAGGMDSKKAAEFTLKLHDQFRDEAQKTVKMILLLKSIAEKESLSVSDEELESKVREMAVQRSQDYDSFRNNLVKEDLLDNIRSEILTSKTYEFLEKQGRVTTVKREAKELAEGTK